MSKQDLDCNTSLLTAKEKAAIEALRACVKALPRSLCLTAEQIPDSAASRPMLWVWKDEAPGDDSTRNAVANMPIRM